jgi:hypothetical protein
MMTRIIGVDPGPEQSAMVILDRRITDAWLQPNELIMERLRGLRLTEPSTPLVIEKIASYGMAVGAEVFETVFWSGRFAEAFGIHRVYRITRPEVKLHLCHSMRAKDANIRQALIDRFGKPGTKKAPGILYGIANDLWSALAVAITWQDQHMASSAGG